MKAVVIREFNGFEAFKVEDIDVPAPGPNELRVAIHTAAINFGDTLISTGRYQVKPVLPFVPGAEGSGIIDAVGPGVTGFKPGDRVCLCGFVGDSRSDRRIAGVCAEKTIVRPDNVIHVPEGMSLGEAALYRSNYETSYYAVVNKANLQSGESMVVLGGASGTGYAAIQIGKALGGLIIASASTEEKRQMALDGGADHAVDTNAPDWRAQVDALVGGRGVDVVYDPIGGDATERAFRSLGLNGRHLVIGFAAGRIPALPINLALMKNASLVGANLLRYFDSGDDEGVAALRAGLLAMYRAGKLKMPPVARRYPLQSAAQAFSDVASGKLAGRVVIDVSDSL